MVTPSERRQKRARDEAAAAAVLARGPVVPPDSDLARVRALLEGHPWRFARTMPNNPHWYTLREQWADDEDFIFVVQCIRAWGGVERFPDAAEGWPYIFLDAGGFHYWTMGNRCVPGSRIPGADTLLINRKPLP